MSPPGFQLLELSKLFASCLLFSLLTDPACCNKSSTAHLLIKRSLTSFRVYVSENIPSYSSIGFRPYVSTYKKRFDTPQYFIKGRIGKFFTPIYVPRYEFIDEGCSRKTSGLYIKDYLNCGVYYTCIPKVITKSYAHFFRKNFYCPEGQDFDEVTSSCVYSPFCYREYPAHPVTQGDLICAQNRLRPVYPEDCQNFFICHWMGYYYAIAHYSCNTFQNYCVKTLYFEDETNLCRGYYNFGNGEDKIAAPCVNGDTRDRHFFPGDRTKYYQCLVVGNRLQAVVRACHVGWYFDAVFRQCILDENGHTPPPTVSKPSITPSTTTPDPTTWNPYPIITTEEPK